MEWPQQIMIFVIDNDLYGFPLLNLEKVVLAKMIEMKPVSVNLPSLFGSAFIDNEPVSLIDMRILFRKLMVENTNETSILVTKRDDVLIGLRCDDVKSVILPERDLHPLPVPLLLEARDYFSGVFLYKQDMVVVINPETLFRSGDIEVIRKVNTQRRDTQTIGYSDYTEDLTSYEYRS